MYILRSIINGVFSPILETDNNGTQFCLRTTTQFKARKYECIFCANFVPFIKLEVGEICQRMSFLPIFDFALISIGTISPMQWKPRGLFSNFFHQRTLSEIKFLTFTPVCSCFVFTYHEFWRLICRDGNRSEPRPEKDRVIHKTESLGNSNQKLVPKQALIS